MWRIGGGDDGFPGFEGAFVEPSPRTPSGESPTIGGFGEADVVMVMLQLNLVCQIAEAEEFERAVALAIDADVTVVLSGTTEEVFNERDEAVWRMSPRSSKRRTGPAARSGSAARRPRTAPNSLPS